MSKSVRLSSSDAPTGRKKKTKMSASAGPTNSHPAALALSRLPRPPHRRRGAVATAGAIGAPALPASGLTACLPRCRCLLSPVPCTLSPVPCPLPRRAARQQPAALLQHPVDVVVQRGERGVHRLCVAHRLLGVVRHTRGDLLPLRHLGRRRHALQLHPEGP